jgi:SagB-type dehydrogenase family enzyme
MPEVTYRLSPYCVVHPLPAGEGVALVHTLYGSRFELSLELLQVLGAMLLGEPPPPDARPPEVQEAVEALVAERVLLPRGQAADRADLFKNRLTPVELAVQRGFNEGGYFPAGIDPTATPGAVKSIPGRASIPLTQYRVFDAQMDLARCLRERRSIRAYAAEPMPRRRLEQFLQLAARAHSLVETPGLGQISFRNYPSAGARYPLELYPVIYGVEGLEPGLYHYHPFHHSLTQLDSEDTHRQGLLETVRDKMGDPSQSRGTPSLLLVVTAVVARTAWKYRGITYQVILQEVGALYQTMYLVATLLDLAPCAVGAFPELAVAEILGIDSRDEAQVGMFALGMREAREAAGPIATITASRALETSPFSGEADRRAVELTLADGSRETLDLRGLRTERAADGALTVAVLGGRQRACLTAEAAASLAALLAPAHGPGGP